MSLGIAFDDSIRASIGADMLLSRLLDKTTEINVINRNNVDSNGFMKGIKLHEDRLEKLQNELCHQATGIS